MTSLINKAKDALSGNKHDHTTTSHHSTTAPGQYTTNDGPHSSNVANKIDPRVDSDRDGRNDPAARTGGLGNTQGYTGSSATTSGHGAVGGQGYGNTATHHAGTHSHTTNDGPHSSKVLNQLDPRVDSDRDGRNDPTSRVGGYGDTQGYTGSSTTTTGHSTYGNTHAPTHGTSGITGGNALGGHTQHSTNAGPHSSNLANKLDPRVDSDRDGRNDPTSRVGGIGQSQGYTGASNTTAGHPTYGNTDTSTHTYGNSGITTGPGVGGSHQHSANSGPHSNAVMNKLDPRVDSDNDGRNDPASRTGGFGNSQGYNPNSTTTAGHNTTGGQGFGHGNGVGAVGHGNGVGAGVGAGAGAGYGSHTAHHAQPVHDSKLLNKLDPRVKDEAAANAAAGNRQY